MKRIILPWENILLKKGLKNIYLLNGSLRNWVLLSLNIMQIQN